jgi:hypothetical protein
MSQELDLKILANMWTIMMQFGHQLMMKSLTKVLTEYETLAYEAICEFVRQKARLDAKQLEGLFNEGSDEAEGGGS